ncbi:MAG: type III pantothenate kinase [Lachnospiraceae bacterium]|nr:type III pantothenate kinase [Lachnospiraceae bacterium]
MIFAIDIGNSNIVAGCIDNKQSYFVERISTDIQKTSTEYAILFKNMLELHGISKKELDGAIISSVVPPISNTIQDAIKKVTGLDAMLVGPGLKTGLNIKIDNPAQLGSDLVVGAVAAMDEYPVPLIIIDMGTATTIFCIDDSGAFIGGAIMPGVMVSLESLTNRTSQLPKISLEAPKKAIGRNTIDCMKSGLVLANASMLDGMIDKMQAELAGPATVIATGGLSQFIIPYCNHEIIWNDTLLLRGLWLIYQKNC